MMKAFIVGINYAGSGYELRGCINDAKNVKAMLESLGFNEIEVMLEKDATTENILAGLKRLVTGLNPGDVIYFHYSGHGSQIYSRVELDKLDEIICPYDLNWKDKVITDNELKNIFNTVPNGVNTTIVLDCCHSGDALDQNESLKYLDELDAELANSSGSLVMPKVRVMTKSIKQRYLPPPEHILNDINTRSLQIRDWNTSRDVNKNALLIAGCRSDQTSADATIAGQPQGAATYSIVTQIKADPTISYRKLVFGMNAFMLKNKFTQRPVLDGNSSLYDRVFAGPWPDLAPPPAPEPAPIPEGSNPVVPVTPDVSSDPITLPPGPELNEKKPDSDYIIVIVGIVTILVAAALFL